MDAHFAVSFQIQHLHRTFEPRMAVSGQKWQEVVGVALTIYPRTARDVSNRETQPDWACIYRELCRKGVTMSLL
jgi:uncharacterized protein (DUF1501 family)